MSQGYDGMVKQETEVFAPVLTRWPLALERGEGSRVWDVNGKEYIDLMSGWGVTCIGHCHPAMTQAINEQAGRLVQTTNIVYSHPQLELGERLARVAPGSIRRSFFLSSGAEANENALKLAHRKTGRSSYVAAVNSFHGRTLGVMGCLGQEKHREPWREIIREQKFVPYGDLEAARVVLDETVAAVIVEPIQGEGGVVVPPDDYLPGLAEACHATGALLILDEVQTGIGRTGRWFASEHSGVVPDILTIAKGLGGGLPIAAFMATEEVLGAIQPGDHGGTYAGNLLCCHVAATVLRVIEEEGLVERAARLGDHVMARLEALQQRVPDRVESVRGKGLLVGIVLREGELAGRVHPQTLERGLVINLTAERVFRVFPALNIPEDDLDQGLDILEELIETL